MVVKLVNTSVAVDHLRGFEPAVAYLAAQLVDEVPLVASEVVRFEILAGARAADMQRVETICRAIDGVPVTEAVAERLRGMRVSTERATAAWMTSATSWPPRLRCSGGGAGESKSPSLPDVPNDGGPVLSEGRTAASL